MYMGIEALGVFKNLLKQIIEVQYVLLYYSAVIQVEARGQTFPFRSEI
jgi:hypothetical protein